MRDSTISRAVRQGVRTTRIPRTSNRKPRAQKSPALTPEQIAAAVQDARDTRIQADLLDYSRSHPMQHDHDDAHSLLRDLNVACA
jgi:hypothetical protein